MAYVVGVCSQTSPMSQIELQTKSHFLMLTMGHTFLFISIKSVSNHK